MVSGFLISPNDHERIFSGEARAILIWSKVGVTGTGLKMFRTSWFIFFPSAGMPREITSGEWRVVSDEAAGDGGVLATRHPPLATHEFSSSTFRPSERISFTSTLNDSGMPASKLSSPRTM